MMRPVPLEIIAGSSPYRHQSVSRHLEFRRGRLHRSGFVRRLDIAPPDGFAVSL
jgi:hypothetical protein